MWDFFVSHASEDKPAVARPLAQTLEGWDFKVWLDEKALTVGDSLRASIERGLSRSRFGVVIISPFFLAKKWPQDELSGLWAREFGASKVLLPVWHNVTREDVAAASPMLADRVAVLTGKGTMYVAQELVRAAFPERKTPSFRHQEFQSAELTNIKSEFRQLLDRRAPLNDVRLFLSAYPALLGTRTVVPAFEVGADDLCDFVVIHTHGVTGGITMEMVLFGSFDSSAGIVAEVERSVRSFAERIDMKIDHADQDYNHNRGRAVAKASRRAMALAQSVSRYTRAPSRTSDRDRNRDEDRPDRWEVALRLVAGRRNLTVADARDPGPTPFRVSISSYDRFCDEVDW
jgi:hypothetical protein